MNKCLKVVCCALFLALAMEVHVPLALCQEEVKTSSVQAVSGTISSIDLEKMTIVIAPEAKTKDAAQKDVVVSVSDLTTIEKNFDFILLGDLSAGDKVEVSYLVGPSGQNVAKSIVVAAGEVKGEVKK